MQQIDKSEVSRWRKVSGDGLEDTSQFKAIYFGFSDYNDRLPSTL